ncbi:MAG: transketolase [Micavibrio aeruginosavorus]|uniref:Transketolase n=1 Tax=Micavibrio aeruginosavorus TaxID=349221 RepID=A0A2W5MSG7_9BACT|nr:MAG: transketolase [Micavibrio aeruginosavorus]
MTKVATKPAESALTQPQMKEMANAIRFLTLDAIKKANSGHSGMPMGMADIATVLYSKFLKFDPANPTWADRDRLIVSNGHGSMLLYALAYLTGYKAMTIDEIKNFRQLHSKTPGHPEIDVSIGVETTTGPLGQGISNAVGFATAERILNAKFGDDLVSHYTYVFAGDGCLMEGVSHEACSLAANLGLGKMIVFYDDNSVTIDGKTDITFTDNTPERFKSYGWDVQTIDGHDLAAIENAIINAQKTATPSLICCKTKIGFGAPTQESKPSAHGAITNDDEIAGTRKNLNWAHGPFEIPADLLDQWRSLGERGADDYAAWQSRLKASSQKAAFEAGLAADVSAIIKPAIAELKKDFAEKKPKLATRQTSGECLEKLIPLLSQMVGGSADLTGSNNTKTKASSVVTKGSYNGNYINYGVREHGMAAAMNGMALHGGIIPYAGTFMQFADYSRPAIRLGALMKQRVIHVMTHDSIGLGEDGPTHQPVEHLAAIRAIPNCYLYRPCDGIETAECWELALQHTSSPSVLSLTRQGVGTVCENRAENECAKGAYILKDSKGAPKVTIFASGSEVELALQAAEKLGDTTRVVSVPCMELFFEQDRKYQDSLCENDSVKVAVEAAVRQGWDAIIGRNGKFVGMKSFGDSAPAGTLYKHFGITAEAVIEAAKS